METLARAANRGSVSTGYDIDNSLKLEADNSEYLSRTPSSASNQRTWTFSAWVKRTELGRAQKIFSAHSANTDAGYLGLYFAASDKLDFETYYRHLFITNEVYRDTSAWYHIVLALDTTDGTSANRIKLYVNGVQITSFGTYNEAQLGQNYEYAINSTTEHRLGSSYFTSIDFSGYMSEVNFVDGSQLAPTEFGEFDEDSGIWKPKAYTGSYGTNGFYLDFESSGSLGADSSGNGNDFTLNNIGAGDQAQDSPTNNFCTLNVLNNKYLTITEGATKSVESTDSVWYGCTTTIGVNNGKWYSEGKAIAIGTGIFFGVTPFNGTADASIGMGSSVFPGNVADTMGYWNGGGGQVYRDNSVVATIGAFAANDIIGIALDMDNGYVYFAKNGTWLNSGNPTSGATGTGGFSLLNPTETHGFAFGLKNSTAGINLSGYKVYTPSSAASDANGYGTFEYAPPSGYYALCTKNLAEYG